MRLRTFIGRSPPRPWPRCVPRWAPMRSSSPTQDDGDGNTRVTAALDDRDNGPDLPRRRYACWATRSNFTAPRSRRAPGSSTTRCNPRWRFRPRRWPRRLGHTFRFTPVAPKDRAILLVGAARRGQDRRPPRSSRRATCWRADACASFRPISRAPAASRSSKLSPRSSACRSQPRIGPAALGSIVDAGRSERAADHRHRRRQPFGTGDRRDLAALIGALERRAVARLRRRRRCRRRQSSVAQIFADLGCTRAVVTQLDATRRLGSVLAVIEAAKLGFAEAGIAARHRRRARCRSHPSAAGALAIARSGC